MKTLIFGIGMSSIPVFACIALGYMTSTFVSSGMNSFCSYLDYVKANQDRIVIQENIKHIASR